MHVTQYVTVTEECKISTGMHDHNIPYATVQVNGCTMQMQIFYMHHSSPMPGRDPLSKAGQLPFPTAFLEVILSLLCL